MQGSVPPGVRRSQPGDVAGYAGFQRIVAVDGTRVALASTTALKRDFGCPFGEHLAPKAVVTVLWDIGGNVPVDWRLGGHDGSEQAALTDML